MAVSCRELLLVLTIFTISVQWVQCFQVDFVPRPHFNGFLEAKHVTAENEREYRLAAKVSRFYFWNGTKSFEDLDTEEIDLGAESREINDSPDVVTRTLRIRSNITEKLKSSVAETLTKLDSVGVEAGVRIAVENNVPLISNDEVKAKVAAKYHYSRDNSDWTAMVSFIFQQRTIAIQQEIKIPSCSVCQIVSFVKMARQFPINYSASAKVSGAKNNEPLIAGDIRNKLPDGLRYVRDEGTHAIRVITEGNMYADFGLVAIIDVNCIRIPKCHSSDNPPLPDHQEYESPILDRLPDPEPTPTTTTEEPTTTTTTEETTTTTTTEEPATTTTTEEPTTTTTTEETTTTTTTEEPTTTTTTEKPSTTSTPKPTPPSPDQDVDFQRWLKNVFYLSLKHFK